MGLHNQSFSSKCLVKVGPTFAQVLFTYQCVSKFLIAFSRNLYKTLIFSAKWTLLISIVLLLQFLFCVTGLSEEGWDKTKASSDKGLVAPSSIKQYTMLL